MSTPLKDRSKAEDSGLGMRLDGWKGIAAYLGKVERTVKRWDADRGLPTHRVPGGGRASVYAYTYELDEWLKSGKASEADADSVNAPANEDEPEPEALAGNVVIAAGAPATASSLPPQGSTMRPGLRLSWRLTLVGVFAAMVLGSAVFPAVLRTTGHKLAHLLPGVFARSHADPTPPEAIAVSASEESQAHDLYLKGRYEWDQRNPDSLNRALDDFTQAIVHDPGYAQAYVGLADTYDLLREYSTMPDSEAYARSIAAARKAVELDDSLADAHRALAFAEWWGEWDFVDGDREFRRAIALNPRDPIARKWYGNVLAVQTRYSEALKQNGKAQELDPTSRSILADRGNMLYYAGRREEGIALLKEVERAAPEFRSPHNYLLLIYLGTRDYPSYLDEGQKAAEAANDPILKDIFASARAGYEQGGERGLLKNLYARQREYYRAGKLWGTMLAKTCIVMGRKQEALQLLEEAYNRHEWYVLSCVSQPDLLTLADEPRYKALVKKINFPPRVQIAQQTTP